MNLVTGATGFAGSYIARWLVAQGEPVRAIRRKNSGLELLGDAADSIEWVEADLLEVPALTDAMQGITQVYHAAAMVSLHPRHRERMMQVNVQGTANVVDAALHAGARRLLHISSVAALGRKSLKESITEQSAWTNSRFNSDYAISKYRSEREAWRGMAEGLDIVMLNPSIIIGGTRWHEGSGNFFSKVDKGLRFYPPGSNSLVDVRDVARMAHTLMHSGISGERFICTAGRLPTRQLLKEIANVLGKKPPGIRVRPWMAGVMWRSEELRYRLMGSRPLITRAIVTNMFADWEYRNDKIRKALGIPFTPLEQSIRETAECYRNTRQQGFGVLEF
jgi:dihydroflavonol-4-reductase